MQFPKDQRVVMALGAGAAVLAGVVIAAVAMGGKDKKPTEAPPASKGGLQVSVDEAPTLDVTRNLRCYVGGQFVGEATLAECARRNGVSAQALDVGLDESGALAAAETASLAPPPPAPIVAPAPTAPVEAPAVEPTPAPQVAVATGPTGACLRHVGGEWRQLSDSVSLNTCVQMLFAGQCERPGGASYGRWGDTTLRLVPKRVEQSEDNRRFRTLVEQGPNCSIPQTR